MIIYYYYYYYYLLRSITLSPCGTISPRIAVSSYRSHRREDRVTKAKRASQLKDVDSAGTRESKILVVLGVVWYKG